MVALGQQQRKLWVSGYIRAGRGLHEVMEDGADSLVAHGALHPCDGRVTDAPGHGRYMVDRRRGIDEGFARIQLDWLFAESHLDHQFPAVVGVRWAEEQRDRKIGTDATNAGTIDVRAILHASIVSAEDRRRDTLWDCK